MSENESNNVINHEPLIHALYEISGTRVGLKRYIARYLKRRGENDGIN